MSNNKQQTAVDKAQELLDKMTMEIGEFNAKHCVMVCVDEMLKVAWFIPDGEIYDYLLKVKEEIEKL